MTEKQSFHAFFIVLATFIAVMVNTLLVTNSELPVILIFSAMLLNTTLALSFLFASLKTTYSKQGISISFFPFMLRKRTIEWKDILSVEIRSYSPLKEFKGWGVRFSKNGRAYTTQGKIGLQIELKDKQKILIGTQKADDLADYINQLYKEGIIIK
mgnify:FL=1